MRVIRNPLFDEPVLLPLADYIIRSKGKTLMRSKKNQLLRYDRAISQ